MLGGEGEGWRYNKGKINKKRGKYIYGGRRSKRKKGQGLGFRGQREEKGYFGGKGWSSCQEIGLKGEISSSGS